MGCHVFRDSSRTVNSKTHSLIVPEKFSNSKSWIIVLLVLVVFGRGPSCQHLTLVRVDPDSLYTHILVPVAASAGAAAQLSNNDAIC